MSHLNQLGRGPGQWIYIYIHACGQTMHLFTVGIPRDQNSPKCRCSANISTFAYWKSDRLLYWDKSHTHLIYEQGTMSNWNIYWKILYVKCVFWHKLIIPKYHTSILNELTFKGNIFPFRNLFTIFCTVFCRRLQPATILTGLIAALTRFPGLLLYAYPCTTMTTSSDLETVDVSWITWVNCSFRISSIFILYCRCICTMLTFYNATKRLHVECLFNLASFSIARTYHYIVWQTTTWQNKNYIFGNNAIPTHYYWPIIAKKIT